MSSFFLLHQGQPDIRYLLDRLTIPSGTQLPAQALDVVICWAHINALPQAKLNGWWLNHPAAVRNASQPENVQELLRANGIEMITVTDRRAMPRKRLRNIRILVFNLRVLSVRDGSDRKLRTVAWNRACRLAVRVVHALQLDFAVVQITVEMSGRLTVSNVETLPILQHEDAVSFANALSNYMRQFDRSFTDARQLRRPPVYGADLEFLLVTPKRLVSPASLYLPREGIAGHDALRIRSPKRLYPIAELRPRPAVNSQKLFEHVYQAMKLADKKINRRQLRWQAGAMPVGRYSLGGHLHISRFWLTGRFLRILDHYLALPLALCEASSSARRRIKYGKLGDFRRQFHGGFEYRTLPSWIVSPQIARGVIALFVLLAESYALLPDFSDAPPLADARLQHAFMTLDKLALSPVVEQCWQTIASLPTYPKYARMIESFRQQSLNRVAWSEQDDLRRHWKMIRDD